jgi:hypothetical protein
VTQLGIFEVACAALLFGPWLLGSDEAPGWLLQPVRSRSRLSVAVRRFSQVSSNPDIVGTHHAFDIRAVGRSLFVHIQRSGRRWMFIHHSLCEQK